MLNIKQLQSETEALKESLLKRGKNFDDLITRAILLDEKRKATQTELESVLGQSKKMANDIGQLTMENETPELNSMKVQVLELKEKS